MGRAGVGAGEGRRRSAMARAAVRLNEVCRETGKLGFWARGQVFSFPELQFPGVYNASCAYGISTFSKSFPPSTHSRTHLGFLPRPLQVRAGSLGD